MIHCWFGNDTVCIVSVVIYRNIKGTPKVGQEIVESIRQLFRRVFNRRPVELGRI